MASINGLNLKNIVEWQGREGPACQGDLYLGDTKICFWSQDGNGGIDTYDFERMFSEEKFRNIINELYKEKSYSYTFGGKECQMKYDVDLLMVDIVELQEKEKEFNKVCSKGYKGLAFISNWGYQRLNPLTSEDVILSDEQLKGKFSFIINEFVNRHGKDDLKVSFYRGKNDFYIGQDINILELYDIRKLKDFCSWDSIQLSDKVLTKEDFLKMNNEEQNKYLNMEVIPSNTFGLFYEKDYYLKDETKDYNKVFELELDER